ncbi:MAG: hypothetical protein JWN14_2544 [Chthonomonadales bacterium]|nr:hypothetical protein [Chthonomonadales bacterium]
MSKFYESDSGSAPDADVLPSPEKKRRVLPVHPLLFAAFPLLAFLAQNVTKIPYQQILSPLITALLGTMVAWLFFLLLTRRDWRAATAAAILMLLYFGNGPLTRSLPTEHQGVILPFALTGVIALFLFLVGTQQSLYTAQAARKAGIAASVAVLLFFSVGHIVDLLPQGLHGLVLPACLLALAALLWVIAKARQPLYDTTAALNLASVVLLVPSFWTIVTQYGTISKNTFSLPRTEDIVPGNQPTVTVDRHLSTAPQDVPDVYYIILDAYGRADRLQTYYGYDNTPFLKALEARGFFIAQQSESNYNQTPLCLASALSMNYLKAPAGQELSPELLREMVDDSAVIQFLRTKGYHYIDVASGIDESRVKTADVVLNDSPELSTLEGSVLDLTAFGAMAAHQRKRYDRHRSRLNGGFDNVAKAAAFPYPKFVFTHILAPHPPFVFDAKGGPVNPNSPLTFADATELLKDITKDEYRRRYIAQLQYVNTRTLEAVDAILRQSKHRPIIIIQGDHGSRLNLDWESLAKTDIKEPFSNLNAYLAPDNVRRDLTDKITAVNSFRIVLTDAFGAKLPRLPDRSYYSTESHPYNFTDITERLARISGDSRSSHLAGGRVRRNRGKASPTPH